jgi:hypothetical protein
MEAIFRLVPDDRVGPVDHSVSYFLAAMGGQAMHEKRVGFG